MRAFFTAPFHFLYWLFVTRPAFNRAHELRLAQIQATAQADAATAIGQAVTDAMRSLGQAQADGMRSMLAMVQEQQKTLQTWLDGFKITELPTSSHTVRDEDEVAAARERMRDMHDPAPATRALSSSELASLLADLEQDTT